MPRKPLKPCRYPGCPELTENRYCIKHQKEIDSNYNKYNRPFKKLYNSRWKKLRKQFLNEHPLCEVCKEHGVIKAATVWNFDRPTKSELHPTMKPVPLVAYPIQNSSMTNCIVFEPFGGSGSTLIACEQTDRICYAVELDEKYCDVIVKRYIEATGDEGVLLIRDG